MARALAVDPPVLLMDEPFGAVDPQVRDRLQLEFRRLQQRLGTTVLLVTHDIDEAVRIADRIAVLSVGGVLEQYDSPAVVLGAPATDFVADFVGSDRGLRRLAVTPIREEDLVHPPTLQVGESTDRALQLLEGSDLDFAVVLDGEDLRGWVSQKTLARGATVGEVRRRFDDTVDVRDSLKTGFSEIVAHDAGWLPVLDGDRYVGVLTPDTVHAALRRMLPDRVARRGPERGRRPDADARSGAPSRLAAVAGPAGGMLPRAHRGPGATLDRLRRTHGPGRRDDDQHG